MNTETVHYLNLFLGTGAILLQVFSVFTLFFLFFGPKSNIFLDYIKKHFLVIGFFISISASLFSLVYSEVIGFLPCVLCWYQRIFLFPQVFIFGAALWERGDKIVKYALPLLSIGFVISVYQNFIYYFADKGSLPCDASGISCYQQLVSEFGGYISIPMLSLTTFFALITLLLVVLFYKRENSN